LTNGDANGHEEVPQKDPLETAGYKIMVSSSCQFPVRVKDSGSFWRDAQATIAESGLGIVSWWNSGEEADDAMEEWIGW